MYLVFLLLFFFAVLNIGYMNKLYAEPQGIDLSFS